MEIAHGSRIQEAGSRIGWSLKNALDFLNKSLQRLLMAIERASRRLSVEVVQENAQEEGNAKSSTPTGGPLQ